MQDKKRILKKLRDANFKITPQRMAIIDALIGNKTHPSADIIYKKIKKKFPMVSFATVYNTLDILKKINELIELPIKENKINYDPNTEAHHHFICEKCGNIIDIYPDINFKPKYIDKHKIKDYKIYFYGICSDCLKNKKEW